MSEPREPVGAIWREWAVIGERTDHDLSGVTFTRTLTPTEVERWPLPVLLYNWKLRLSDKYRRWLVVSNGELPVDGRQVVSDLRAWIALTRSLADRFPFGDTLPTRMSALATEVGAALEWAGSRLADPPSDLTGVANLSLNVDLWAADQVRERLGEPRSRWFDALFMPIDDDVPGGRSEAALEQRIRRTSDRIISGQEANLVADVLDALRAGPLGHADTPPQPDAVSEATEARTSWASR